LITNPIQTQRALLTWQSPLGADGSRARHAVGELVARNGSVLFRYLTGTTGFDCALEEGFAGYPGLPLRLGGDYSDALDIFLRRLPHVGRTDYNSFLGTFGLSPDAPWTGLSLLAYTGARLASDSFSITETFEGFDRPFEFIFDVAGYRRRQENGAGLVGGETLRLVHEPTNTVDPTAVQVLRAGGELLGYISKLQSERVVGWVRAGVIQAHVFRVNGRPVYPRLFVMARIDPTAIARAA
jgi:hypothetical protein